MFLSSCFLALPCGIPEVGGNLVKFAFPSSSGEYKSILLVSERGKGRKEHWTGED